MNYFDQFLELNLRQMLDPVVADRAPGRRGRKAPVLHLEPDLPAMVGDRIAGEPAVVTVPLAPGL